MKKMIGDNFDESVKYKLYRNVYEVVHPTISKKNISSYKIITLEELLPILVFYPKRVSNLNSVIIFIPGDGNVSGCKNEYSNICKEMSMECDKLVIAIDYFHLQNKFPNVLEQCYKTIKYLVSELEHIGISKDNITLMGDSTGANLISAMTIKSITCKENFVLREILLYPVLSGEYFGKTNYESISRNNEFDLFTIKRVESFMKNYISCRRDLRNPLVCPLRCNDYDSFPATLVITGDLDPLRDEGSDYAQKLISKNKNSKYCNIRFAVHGFLKSGDVEVKSEMYSQIKEFLK